MLTRLAHLTVRHRWPMIGAWLVLTVFGAFAAGQVSYALVPEHVDPRQAGVRGEPADAGARSVSARARPSVVVFHTSGDATKSAAIEQAIERAAAGDARARSRARTSRPGASPTSRPTGTRRSARCIRPAPAELDAPSGAETMRAAAANGLPAGITVNVTGRDALGEATKHGTGGGSTVLVEAIIGGVGALVILLFVFGTLPAVLLPIVVAISAILNTFTLVWALTYVTDVSIIVQFLIALVGLGVAIDYALLMIFRFRDELREGNDVESAVVETMTHAGRSVIVSGSTVAIGLLSLVFLPLPLIRSIGVAGMLIPAVSVLASITLLPAMLAVLGAAHQQRPRDAAPPDRPRPRRGRRLGPLGAVRAAPPGRRRAPSASRSSPCWPGSARS